MYIIIYCVHFHTQLPIFGFVLFATLRQYKIQCDWYKYNYKSLLSLTLNFKTYINTVNITELFPCE